MKEKIKKYINIGAGFIILGLLTYLLVNQILDYIPFLTLNNPEIFGTFFWWIIMVILIYLVLKKVYQEFKK